MRDWQSERTRRPTFAKLKNATSVTWTVSSAWREALVLHSNLQARCWGGFQCRVMSIAGIDIHLGYPWWISLFMDIHAHHGCRQPRPEPKPKRCMSHIDFHQGYGYPTTIYHTDIHYGHRDFLPTSQTDVQVYLGRFTILQFKTVDCCARHLVGYAPTPLVWSVYAFQSA